MTKYKKKKNKKVINYIYLLILLFILAGGSVFFYKKYNIARPVAFDIYIPAHYTTCGIDVSRYQKKINWEKVSKAYSGKDSLRISFAFIKATEGESLTDPCFDYNWKNSKKHKILRGAYHYYRPNINSALQARNFIKSVKIERGDLPPVLDIEELGDLGNDNMKKGIKNWLTIIENHYGVKPIIYSYANFYELHLFADEFKDYPFWIAHYYTEKLKVKDDWHFWQHSDRGRVNGIAADVDFNVFNGSLHELKSLCK